MKAYIYVLVATFLFSSMETVLKYIGMQVNALDLVFYRFLIAGLILLPMAVRTLKKRIAFKDIRKKDWLFFASMGFICVVISMVSVQLALELIPASNVALIICCIPAFTVVFARLFLKEQIYLLAVLTIALCIVGIVFIINPSHTSLPPAGVFMALISAITFSIYTVLSRRKADQYSMVSVCCFCFLFGSLEMLLLIAAGHIPVLADFYILAGLTQFANVNLLSGITLKNLPVLLYAGVGITGLGYMLFFQAMIEKTAAFASISFLIKPVLATLFSVWLLHETVNGSMIIGIILILLGSSILLWSNIRLEKGKRLKTLGKPYSDFST